MKTTDVGKDGKRAAAFVRSALPNRRTESSLLPTREETPVITWFSDRRKSQSSRDDLLQLSSYLRKVNELRRENERLKRELASLQKRWGGEPVAQPEGAAQATLQLRQFASSLERLLSGGLKETFLLGTLRELQRSLDRTLRELDPRLNDQELRGLVVESMRLSLELWLESTRSSKADLARRSGQWSVYVNQDGWERTQGFDRYLDIVTLPDHPRLKKVLHTGDFVLQSCPEPAELRQRLGDSLSRLRALKRPVSFNS